MEHLSPFRSPQIQQAPTSSAAAGIEAPQSKDLNLAQLGKLAFSLSAAPLTGATFGANAAGAGTDHLVAAANRTGDSHEDAAKRDCYTVSVTVAVSVLSARL